jgi:hypothetical protein
VRSPGFTTYPSSITILAIVSSEAGIKIMSLSINEDYEYSTGYNPFTILTGRASTNAFKLSKAISINLARAAFVAQEMCGVM